MPNFDLNARAAATVTSDTHTRENLTSGLFIPKDPAHPIAKLEYAFELACETEGLERKLKKFDKTEGRNQSTPLPQRVEFAVSAGALTREEGDDLLKAQVSRREVTDVDSFTIDMKPTQ